EMRILHRHAEQALGLAVSPNGRFVASCGRDDVARLWDASQGVSRELRPGGKFVYQVAFSPDSRLLLAASDEGVHLWNLESSEERFFPARRPSLFFAGFSPSGKEIVAAGVDRNIVIWNAATGEARTFVGHEAMVKSVAFHPTENYIASGSDDRTVRIWD